LTVSGESNHRGSTRVEKYYSAWYYDYLPNKRRIQLIIEIGLTLHP